MLTLCLVLVVAHIGSSLAATYPFLTFSPHFETSLNYYTNLEPAHKCPNDRIIFKKESLKMSVTYGMSYDPSFSEMLFANDMAITFDKGVKFGTDPTTPSCKHPSNRTYTATRHSWFDPACWRHRVTTPGSSPGFLLHAEQIPNQDTAVHLEKAFDVAWDIEDIATVGSFKYRGRYVGTLELHEILSTEEGQWTFSDERIVGRTTKDLIEVVGHKILDTKNSCWKGDGDGCVQSNLDKMTSICNYVKCPPQPECEDPLEPPPLGHCCPLCGAKLTFRSKGSFNYPDNRYKINKILTISKSGCTASLIVTAKNTEYKEYQIVIVPDSWDSEGLRKCSELIYNYLEEKETAQELYEIAMLQSSDPTVTTPTSRAIAITLVVLILLITIVVVIVYARRRNIAWKQRLPSAMFRRPQAEDEIELQMSMPFDDGNSARATNTGTGSVSQFTLRKPKPRMQAPSYKKLQEEAESSSTTTTAGSIENPLFNVSSNVAVKQHNC